MSVVLKSRWPIHSCSVRSGTPAPPIRVPKVWRRSWKRTSLTRARVREVRFHDLRHTFGTRMGGAGVPLRTLQEWMGHRDFKTTLIYADYQPSEREAELVEKAFGEGLRSDLTLGGTP